MQQQCGTTLSFHAKITKEYNTHNFLGFGSETKDQNFTHTNKSQKERKKKKKAKKPCRNDPDAVKPC